MLVRDWVLEPNVSLRLGFVKTASDFKNPILPTLGFQKPNLEGPTTTKISQNRKSASGAGAHTDTKRELYTMYNTFTEYGFIRDA